MKKVVGSILGLLLILNSCSHYQENKTLLVVDKARFTVIAPECIRMEYSKTGKFTDEKSLFAVNRDARFNDYRTIQKDGSTIIDTGKIRLVYCPDGKPFNEQNLKAFIKRGSEIVEWNPAQKNTQNLGGTIRTVDGVVGPVDLGEGLLSRDGWYLLDDSKRHIFTNDWVVQRPKGSGTDWYLFGYGYDYKSALKAMTKIGGKVPMPRKYALGVWYSRYWPYSSDDYRKIVNQYQRHDFPLDVIVLDMDWHKDGWTGWSWNRKLLPDAENLLKWFHQQGLFVTLNVHPADGVGPQEDMYKDFMKAMGKNPASGKAIPFDAGNKKYLDTLFKYTHTPLEKEGVDFWWLDWQQYPFTISIPDLTNLWWLNHYYYQHTSQNNMRGQSFSRWAGWGDHRHPIHFSGDANTGWPMLAFEVPLTSTAGNIGCFFWSHDMGGHMGPRNEESYTRWVQFGATTAALRSHSTRSAELDRRPWKYSKQAEESMRMSFHLRSKLFPYLYSTVWQCHKDSIPMTRPMYIEYPEDDRAYRNPQQYFFGDTFLAAPIVSPGIGTDKIATQAVWFPKGDWYNWFTGEKYTGDTEAVVTADINEFPLYAKGGVPIPIQNYTPRMTTTPLKELVIRCYPGKEGNLGAYQLYEDDGISQDYLKGKYATTDLSYLRNGNTVTITISPAKGTFKGQVKERSYVIQLPCTQKAESTEINNLPVETKYDDKTLTTSINVPLHSIDQSITITVNVADADFAALSKKTIQSRMQGLSTSDPSMLEAMMANYGIALYDKNESLYLYKGKGNLYLYNNSDLVDGNDFEVKVIDIIGGKENVVSAQYCKVKDSKVKIDQPPLIEPPLGSTMKRIVRAEFKMNDKPITISKTIAQKDSFLSKWSIVGPFDFDTMSSLADQGYGPEIDKIDLAAMYKGADGKKVKWQKAKCYKNGIVDLRRYYDFDNRIAYAVTYLNSDNEQEVTFKINSDDGVEAFLNGKKIHSKNVARSIYTQPDIVKATLKAGENVLLLKISQYGGDWAFRVGIESANPIKESGQ